MSKPGSSERPDWPLAVIVGAGGMGRVVARRLGLRHRVLLADRNGDHAEAVAAAMRDDGCDAIAIACDVTRPDDVRRLADAAQASGCVRTLANVVGLSVGSHDFRAIMEVNLAGAAAIAEAFCSILVPGGCGVFISSSSAHMGHLPDKLQLLLEDPLAEDLVCRLEAELGDQATDAVAYMYSKVGLNRMCRRLAALWGEKGLRIVSLSPGLISTPMGAEAYRHSPGKRRLYDAIPLRREGTMLEIANVVDFLASDAASFITGTDILVDGGMIAAVEQRLR